ncbi:hypothetical protein [Parasitella parasitica]|uniref:Transferrin receptor-like dimerisation domain-containing protein n=1 Tax=Parasitella parasitica TaxID=35722 RepID=A0A0B7N8X4_9FUNG|nr:hypothetical protein [Parasitella parasitica]
MVGSIASPSNEDRSGIKQGRWWFAKRLNGDTDENTPLMNYELRTAKSRKKTTFCTVITAVILIISLTILGVAASLWYDKQHDVKKPSNKLPSELTEAERIMLDLPSSKNVRDYLKTYTSKAHLAGTLTDKKQAEWTRDQFESFGLETKIDTYWPLLNYPVSHRLALVSGPKRFRFEAKLAEDPVDEDETSKDPNVVPLFHGYSKNGTVQGRIVYANYGRLEDFQFLKDQGINLNGTIALMRYGGNFRGLKVRAAETFGCAGALIYSDPIDDGPLNKDNSSNPAESYPDGPWRSKSSAQRGSVQFFSVIAGDPLTPGYPATENATRIKYEDSPGVPKIPSLPLSWEDALPILKATQGLGVRGEKDWAASPSLNRLLYNVVSEIIDPRTGKSVFEAWKADQKLADNEDPQVLRLGSGSDFTPFLDHVGIASINFAFVGDYGVYHSNYDSFHWMEKFGDPGFLYHQTLVKLWGLLALRLSDSTILPIYPSDYSTEIAKYAVEIADMAAPRTFPDLDLAIGKLQKITRHFERQRQHLENSLAEYKPLDDIPSDLVKRLATINDRLAFFERGFIDNEGIKDRDWFKHVIFAPGLWTGYASQVFPAIADGIEAKDYAQALHAEARAVWAIEQAFNSLKDE